MNKPQEAIQKEMGVIELAAKYDESPDYVSGLNKMRKFNGSDTYKAGYEKGVSFADRFRSSTRNTYSYARVILSQNREDKLTLDDKIEEVVGFKGSVQEKSAKVDEDFNDLLERVMLGQGGYNNE